jgi:hypothetical protein
VRAPQLTLPLEYFSATLTTFSPCLGSSIACRKGESAIRLVLAPPVATIALLAGAEAVEACVIVVAVAVAIMDGIEDGFVLSKGTQYKETVQDTIHSLLKEILGNSLHLPSPGHKLALPPLTPAPSALPLAARCCRFSANRSPPIRRYVNSGILY